MDKSSWVQFANNIQIVTNCLGSKDEERYRRLMDDISPRVSSSFFLICKNVRGTFIFDCDYDVKFLDLNNIHCTSVLH